MIEVIIIIYITTPELLQTDMKNQLIMILLLVFAAILPQFVVAINLNEEIEKILARPEAQSASLSIEAGIFDRNDPFALLRPVYSLNPLKLHRPASNTKGLFSAFSLSMSVNVR